MAFDGSFIDYPANESLFFSSVLSFLERHSIHVSSITRGSIKEILSVFTREYFSIVKCRVGKNWTKIKAPIEEADDSVEAVVGLLPLSLSLSLF